MKIKNKREAWKIAEENASRNEWNSPMLASGEKRVSLKKSERDKSGNSRDLYYPRIRSHTKSTKADRSHQSGEYETAKEEVKSSHSKFLKKKKNRAAAVGSPVSTIDSPRPVTEDIQSKVEPTEGS